MGHPKCYTLKKSRARYYLFNKYLYCTPHLMKRRQNQFSQKGQLHSLVSRFHSETPKMKRLETPSERISFQIRARICLDSYHKKMHSMQGDLKQTQIREQLLESLAPVMKEMETRMAKTHNGDNAEDKPKSMQFLFLQEIVSNSS